MSPSVSVTDIVDRVRRDVERSRFRARNGIKLLLGTDPPKVGVTPKDVVWTRDEVQLYRYRSEARSHRPPLVIVHSLITRPFIFDLQPRNSTVEYLLAQGFDVFLIDWGIPGELESTNTLSTYCDSYLPRAVAAACEAASSDGVSLLGYCMGGVLAALYAAGHPELTKNLVAMATPCDLTKLGPPLSTFADRRIAVDDVVDDSGNVPPAVIMNAFRTLQPTGELVEYANLWQHLWNDRYVEAHQAITAWSRQHIPFPGDVMRELVDRFVPEGGLAGGSVSLGNRRVCMSDVRCPFLNVLTEHDHIVPVECARPLTSVVGSADREEVVLPSGHAALFIGSGAFKRCLPAIADWLVRHES